MAQQFDIVGSLFGFSPEAVQQQITAEQQKRAMDIAGGVTGGLGPAVFQAARAQEAARGTPLFEMQQDPRLIKARAMSNARQAAAPAFQQGGMVGYMNEYANQLEAAGLTAEAAQARAAAAEEQRKAAESASKIFQQQAAGTASLASAARERTPAAAEQADRIRLEELQRQFGPVEGARKFREERDEIARRTAAAAVPPPAKAFGTDIALRTDFLKEVQPIDTALGSLDRTEALLNEQSGLADAVAKRAFSKFAGDRDISNKDVAAFGNFGPLGQRLGGILSQFFEGTYSDAQRQEALRIVRNLRNPLEQQRSSAAKAFADAARRQRLEEDAISFVVPSRTAGIRPVPAPGETTAPTTGTITLPSGNKARPL
jgi:hypothetical protein